MPTPALVRMPKLGMTMEEGTVVEWRIAIGERVEKGELLLIIESEKNEAEIEATASGFLRHTFVPEGDVVPCGALLAALTEAADEAFDAEALAAAEAPLAPAEPEPAPPARAAAPAAAAAAAGRRAVAPAARALAKKLGLDLERVAGSGPGGRVIKQDVEAFAAARERLVPVAEGVAVEVLREGQGEPVLLIPGFGTDASSFAALIPGLAEHFEVLAMNPRGVGASDPTGDGYDMATMAADAAAVIAEISPDRPAHVVGASLGAATALELALTQPGRVGSLTLITPFVSATPRLLAVRDAWCGVAEEASAAVLARFLASLLFSDTLLGDERRRERTMRGLAAALPRVPAATLVHTAAALAGWSGSRAGDLASVEARTLVLAAGSDLLTPDAEAIAAEIPRATCVVVPGAGHALAIDAPDAVSEALAKHLAPA
jgi:pyruvate dehydrogenase E2 component (dihydrolipoamide acetyltransferase)